VIAPGSSNANCRLFAIAIRIHQHRRGRPSAATSPARAAMSSLRHPRRRLRVRCGSGSLVLRTAGHLPDHVRFVIASTPPLPLAFSIPALAPS